MGTSKNRLRGHLLRLRVSAQYLLRSLRFFEVPYSIQLSHISSFPSACVGNSAPPLRAELFHAIYFQILLAARKFAESPTMRFSLFAQGLPCFDSLSA